MKDYLLITLTLSIFSLTVSAGTHYSAHNCQVLGRSEQVAYHTAGSLIALTNNVRVSCPMSAVFFHPNMHARVRFNTLLSTPTAGNLISCYINKTSPTNGGVQGPTQSAGIPIIEDLRLSNFHNVSGAVGANIVCRLQREAKILGYYVF